MEEQSITEVSEVLSRECLLCQLAEEASELAQAALKLARIYRGENPTPVTEEEAYRNLVEEFTDVTLAADEFAPLFDCKLANMKMRRWRERLGIE